MHDPGPKGAKRDEPLQSETRMQFARRFLAALDRNPEVRDPG
jgi:hypothetical protein